MASQTPASRRLLICLKNGSSMLPYLTSVEDLRIMGTIKMQIKINDLEGFGNAETVGEPCAATAFPILVTGTAL